MGSHFRVNATPVTSTFTIPPVSVTKIGPSRWNRMMRKHPFVDSIIKLMFSALVKELVDWARDFVPQLFQRERTASEAHGSVHAA